MSDIKIIWLGFKQPSIAIENGDFTRDDTLKTAVIISLFTDRLANTDDVLPDGGTDRRGWWADAFPDVPFDRIGSRLWLLHREKQLSRVLERAREYALEALQWLIDDGIAAAVDVVAMNPSMGMLLLDIKIDRPQGVENYQFDALWEAA